MGIKYHSITDDMIVVELGYMAKMCIKVNLLNNNNGNNNKDKDQDIDNDNINNENIKNNSIISYPLNNPNPT